MFSTPASLLTQLQHSPGPESWGRFVELYTPVMMTWANRLHRSPDRMADLVQDVFAILVEQMPYFKYDPQRSFRAWLKTVLLNCWRKQHRREQTDRQRTALDLPEVPDPLDFPELEEEEYRAHVVRRALELMQREFEPSTWKACWEFVVNDRPAPEVAAELNLSVNAVYLSKSRVLRRLRSELADLLE